MRRRLSSVVVCNTPCVGPAGVFVRAGQAMTSCRFQSNYSCTVKLHGGPVVLRPVTATPCFQCKDDLIAADTDDDDDDDDDEDQCVLKTDSLIQLYIQTVTCR